MLGHKLKIFYLGPRLFGAYVAAIGVLALS